MSGTKFVSTRGAAEAVDFSLAIVRGLAPDGGLYVPARWPSVSPDEFSSAATLAEIAATVLAPLLEGDPLAGELNAIAAEAFNFPAPLIVLDPARKLAVLELFHGPTAAFKDFGARFLAGCLTRLRIGAARPLLILVATSGDTGGAVAAAFHNRPGIEVAVLFPKGLVSPTQQRQLICWGGNVRALAVRGTFDDCQRMVKAAFRDAELCERYDLSSANSINLGRLAPQMVSFAATSLGAWREHGETTSFVVPSGNLGHGVACIWARRLGLPIGEIVLAHNANRTVPDYFDSGEWRPRASVATLASAMDVGDPSNAERLRHLYPHLENLREATTAYTVDDESIRARIRAGLLEYGQIWCPHTASAAEAYARHAGSGKAPGRWVLAATAHPAKFNEVIAPLIGRKAPLPPALAELSQHSASIAEIGPDLAALRGALERD